MANKTKRAAIYLRVSTTGQTIENQRRELEQVAQRRGWSVVEVYQDEGISGAKGRDRRPGFDRMLKDASRRKFDVVMAWAKDRLGRSLIDRKRCESTVGSARIDGPGPREQFGEAAIGPVVDELGQHLGQVGLWVDAVQLARLDQRGEHRPVFRPFATAGE